MLKAILIIIAVLVISSAIEITIYKKKTKKDEAEIEAAMIEFLEGEKKYE